MEGCESHGAKPTACSMTAQNPAWSCKSKEGGFPYSRPHLPEPASCSILSSLYSYTAGWKN